MLLTIAIPTYNRAPDLLNMLESIKSETTNNTISNNIEILVIDNCSTDETRSLCAEYSSNIRNFRYIRNEHNIGLTGNMYKCLTEALGEYIWAIGDDETILKNGLDRVIECISQSKDDLYIFNYSSEPEPTDEKFLKTNHGRPLLNKKGSLIDIVNDLGWLWCLGNLGMVVAKRAVFEGIDFDSYSSCSFAQAAWYLESFSNRTAQYVDTPIFRTYTRSQTVNKERWKTDGTELSFLKLKDSVATLANKKVIADRVPLKFFNGCSQDRFPIWGYIMRLLNEEIKNGRLDNCDNYCLVIIELVSRIKEDRIRVESLKNVMRAITGIATLRAERSRFSHQIASMQSESNKSVESFVHLWNEVYRELLNYEV